MRVSVKVQPRASRIEVSENADGSLKVHLKAAPTDGKANKSLIEALADYYSVKKADIRIITGENNRKKIVEINRR
ncbi:MAG: DUF167 domain-containing protein [Candidatus Omnitrophica bacterium]|nr:DUF167 domain-containing protein [Candidatus Omnitrophota bacterium]